MSLMPFATLYSALVGSWAFAIAQLMLSGDGLC
jgi:hypothetical protein